MLPVNDTQVYGMWWDSYPYKAISVFALHPMYLSLDDLCGGSPPSQLAALIADARADGEAKTAVDYEATLRVKLQVARAVFASEQGQRYVVYVLYPTQVSALSTQAISRQGYGHI